MFDWLKEIYWENVLNWVDWLKGKQKFKCPYCQVYWFDQSLWPGWLLNFGLFSLNQRLCQTCELTVHYYPFKRR